MAIIARALIDTSASARAHLPEVLAVLDPVIRDGLAATCSILDAEALHSARNRDDYERIWARRRRAYEYLPTEDRHHRAALDAQRRLSRTGRHRSVGFADLVLSVLAAEQGLTVLHYDADFEIAAEVIPVSHQWAAPRGSVP